MLITLGSCTVFIIHPRKTFATLNPEYTLEILRLSVLKIILYYVESFFFWFYKVINRSYPILN